MKQANINQEQLAEKIGCSRKTINQYCNGKGIPDEYNRGELAKEFHVSAEYLLGEAKYPRCSDEVGDACTSADSALGNDGQKELAFQVELIRRFCKEYDIEITDYTAKQQKQLEKEIRDFIQFKVNQLKKGKGK